MRKLLTFTLGTFVLSPALLSPAMAQSGFYIGPEVGYTFYDSDRDIDDEVGFGLLAGYQFDENWAAELEYYVSDADLEVTPPGGGIDLDRWAAHGRYFFGDGDWQPFLLAGLGHQELDSNSSDDNETLLIAGAGLEGHLGHNWRLRGDARAFHSHDDSFTDFGVHIALTYIFGAERASPEPRRAEPQPVAQPEPAPAARPAPPPAPEPRTEEVRYVLNILFPYNSAEVEAKYSDELSEIAALMRQYPESNVIIEGHTDNTGNADYNQKLSEQRAHAVKQLLTSSHGIDRGRVNAVGFGESRPVADNSTVEGRAVNRRIEAVLTYQKTLDPSEYQP